MGLIREGMKEHATLIIEVMWYAVVMTLRAARDADCIQQVRTKFSRPIAGTIATQVKARIDGQLLLRFLMVATMPTLCCVLLFKLHVGECVAEVPVAALSATIVHRS